MGAVQVPDEIQRLIERQVAEGRATSPAAFLEEAVLRLLDARQAEEEEIRLLAEAGIADSAAERFTVIATDEDAQALRERLVARLRASIVSNSRRCAKEK
jgi:Arc/MetJ-type ribon-helix-helix transcriptional regulator